MKTLGNALAKTALFFSVAFAIYIMVRLYTIYHGGAVIVIG